MKYMDINGIIVEIEKKKIKNMYLRIFPPDGRVHISSPTGMSEREIKRFLLSKIDWIKIQQNKIQNRNIKQELQYISGEKHFVWGIEKSLMVKEGTARNSVDMIGDCLILSIKKGSTIDQRKELMKGWYRNAILQEIPYLISKWETIIDVKSAGFTIRDMKTRWGTCNIRTKNICLNLQLAKKPPICLEYVVVHELVHLLERSHNAVFKAYMDKFLPQWRIIRKQLNE